MTSDAPQAIMFFAAGFGTRMGVLTQNRPKPLIEVAGRPLIDHALDIANAHGPLRKVANLHYKAEMLDAHLASKGVALSIESPTILDTGGGLKAAMPLLGGGPVFTMNTDVVWSGPNPLDCLAAAWEPGRMEALVLCIPQQNAVGRDGPGDFRTDEQGHVFRGGDLIYSGAQIMFPQAVLRHPDQVFSLNSVWDDIAARGRLFAITYPGRWCDVGHPDGLKLAEYLLSEPHV